MTQNLVSAPTPSVVGDQATSAGSADTTASQAAGEPLTGASAQLSGEKAGKRTKEDVGPTERKQPAKANSQAGGSKSDIVLKKLHLARGVTVAQIMEVTGWQSHSVRGFLSAVVRKKLGLNLMSEVGKDSQRRYRVIDGGTNAGQAG